MISLFRILRALFIIAANPKHPNQRKLDKVTSAIYRDHVTTMQPQHVTRCGPRIDDPNWRP